MTFEALVVGSENPAQRLALLPILVSIAPPLAASRELRVTSEVLVEDSGTPRGTVFLVPFSEWKAPPGEPPVTTYYELLGSQALPFPTGLLTEVVASEAGPAGFRHLSRSVCARRTPRHAMELATPPASHAGALPDARTWRRQALC